MGHRRAGAERAQQQVNAELLFRRPDKGDPDAQKTALQMVRDDGAKAIAVSVVDPDKEADFLNAMAADVPLMCVDNDAPNTKRLCYIGTDNYQAGQAAARLVQEALPDGGKIVVFVGNLEADNAHNRRQGLIDELNGAKVDEVKDGAEYGKDKKYTLVKTYLDQADEEKAEANAVEALGSDALKDAPHVCLIGLYAYNTPKILSAAAGKSKLGKVKIVAFDEDDKTLQGIADGNVVGTVVQNPYLFGAESVKVLAAIARGDMGGIPTDKVRYIPFRIITKEGGKDYPGMNHGEPKSIPVQAFQESLKLSLAKPAS